VVWRQKNGIDRAARRFCRQTLGWRLWPRWAPSPTSLTLLSHCVLSSCECVGSASMCWGISWCLLLAVPFHGKLLAEHDVLLLLLIKSKRRS
jgi:hypothetical protein